MPTRKQRRVNKKDSNGFRSSGENAAANTMEEEGTSDHGETGSRMLLRSCRMLLRSRVDSVCVSTSNDNGVKSKTASSCRRKNSDGKRKLDKGSSKESQEHESPSSGRRGDTTLSGAKTPMGGKKYEVLHTRQLRPRTPVQYTFPKDFLKPNGRVRTYELRSQSKSFSDQKPKKDQSEAFYANKSATVGKCSINSTNIRPPLKASFSENQVENLHKMHLRGKTAVHPFLKNVCIPLRRVSSSPERKPLRTSNRNTVNGISRSKTKPKSLQITSVKLWSKKKNQVNSDLPKEMTDCETTGAKSKMSQKKSQEKKLNNNVNCNLVPNDNITNKNSYWKENCKKITLAPGARLKNVRGRKQKVSCVVEGFEDIFKHGWFTDHDRRLDLDVSESDSDGNESLIRNLATPDLCRTDSSELNTPVSSTSSFLELPQDEVKKHLKKRMTLLKKKKATPTIKKSLKKVDVINCMKKFAKLDAISRKRRQKENEFSESEDWVSTDEEEIHDLKV